MDRAERSSIRDRFGDRRNLVVSRAARCSTPGPHSYASVPELDLLRMSQTTPGTAARLTKLRRPLSDTLRSKSNLSSTLSELTATAEPPSPFTRHLVPTSTSNLFWGD